MHVHGRQLKETVLWVTITWCEMEKHTEHTSLKGLFLRAAINSCEVIKFVNDVCQNMSPVCPSPPPN